MHISIGLPAGHSAKHRDFNSFYGWFRQMVYGRCPRRDSVRPVRGSAVGGLEMHGQLPVGVAAMRDFVLLVVSHLGECFL